MKEYPTISKEHNKDLSFYVFDKLDGSNIRAVWSRKKGFFKFGSRHVLLDETDKYNKLASAPQLIRETYETDITPILKDLRVESATLFFEFLGPQSFAGNHVEGDNFSVTLFDVDLYKHGLMMPDAFLKSFGHLKIPTLIHHGKVNQELVDAVKNSSLAEMSFEGVVCKSRNPKKTLQPVMFKIKSQAWLDKLKNFCGEDAELFKRLA